jgi:hypothetical protein
MRKRNVDIFFRSSDDHDASLRLKVIERPRSVSAVSLRSLALARARELNPDPNFVDRRVAHLGVESLTIRQPCGSSILRRRDVQIAFAKHVHSQNLEEAASFHLLKLREERVDRRRTDWLKERVQARKGQCVIPEPPKYSVRKTVGALLHRRFTGRK